MTRKRNMAAIAAIGTLVLAVSACSSSGGGGGSKGGSGSSGGGAKGAVIMGTTDSVTTLDPAGAYDHGSWAIIFNVYQTLLTIPAGKTTPVPDAAQKCEFSDPKTFTCTLKDNQKFSNGDTLTSKDVKFSFDRLLKINDPNGPASIFQGILKTVTAPDAKTVTFSLANADATFPQRVATAAGAIVDAKVFPAGKLLDDTKVVGSGVYKIAKYTPKQIAQFVPNPNYGGTTKTANSQFVVQYFTEPSAMKQAVEQKKIDIAYRTFSPTDLAALGKESAKGVTVVQGSGTEKRYTVFNTKTGPGKDKAVRQAYATLLDRSQIASQVYNNTVEPLYGMVGIGVEGATTPFKDLYGATPDKAKAAKILKDAGVTTPVKLTLWWTPSHYGPSSADEFTAIKRQMDASGLFNITLKSTEWQAYQKAYKAGQYEAYQIGWFPDFPDADNDFTPFFAKEPFLYTAYQNPAVQKLITEEQGTTDAAKRDAAFKTAEKLTAGDAVVVPMWQGKLNAVTSDTVSGVDKALDPQYFRFDLVSKK